LYLTINAADAGIVRPEDVPLELYAMAVPVPDAPTMYTLLVESTQTSYPISTLEVMSTMARHCTNPTELYFIMNAAEIGTVSPEDVPSELYTVPDIVPGTLPAI
jgi:hypothetical protein